MCADVLLRAWKDPYVVRHGRNGQRQHGVDIYGLPEHLGGAAAKKYAAAQCKNTATLTLADIKAEVALATDFRPSISEYVVMTTIPRDAGLQEEVRVAAWPFPVHLLFWEDISLRLSGHEDLLQKHFPGWAKARTSIDHVMGVIANAAPSDFQYDDGKGIYVYRNDVALRLELDRSLDDRDFDEPWVRKFPNPKAKVEVVRIIYGTTPVGDVYCASVDGGRFVIPYPKSRDELVLTPLKYQVGRIVNHPFPGYPFDSGLQRAGITVSGD